jgi:competence protein ComEA
VSYASGSSSADSGSLGIDANGGDDVVVDVAGEVTRPGVYRLPAGSRVNDAVKRAGGATGTGDVEQINLAARLADGQQVVVPAAVKSPAGVAGGAAAPGSAAAEGPIGLGTATVEDLDTIEGIGPVTAQNIIDYRDQHGGVSSVDQLDEIDGIGPATMDALRARLQP